MDMLSRQNTLPLRGLAALGIVVFHVLLMLCSHPFINMWGGHFVALFLVLSGYGLEESRRQKGLADYWHRRIQRVVLPVAFFIVAYNYLFAHIPVLRFRLEDAGMQRCLDELLYLRPSFWFVFFILKCYLVYWVGTRFLSGRLRWAFFAGCALVQLNLSSPSGHLEAEQSLSFLAGVLLSQKREWVARQRGRKLWGWTLLLLAIGGICLVLKTYTPLHALKGTTPYAYLLCPFRLTWGLALVPILSALRPHRLGVVQTLGKYSLEIYVAHIPFMRMLPADGGLLAFLVCSLIGFAILMIYRKFVQDKLGISEAIFILVNVVFVAKYAERISEGVAFWCTLAAAVGYYVVKSLPLPLRRRGELPRKPPSFGGVGGGFFCVIIFISALLVQYAIDPWELQVDRWSALYSPIRNLLPVWQLLHVPFYLLGNVGLSFFAAAAFFVWSIRKAYGKERAVRVGLLMSLSVAVWYEVAVRSDLITNLLLAAGIIVLFLPRMTDAWVERWRWWIAVGVGLLASTRLIVQVPVGLLLLPWLRRMSLRRQCALALLTFCVFALTFLPFALWDWQQFYHFRNNPWALQTRQGNASDFLLFVPLALFLAMEWKGCAFRYYRNSALMLVVLVGVTFAHNMYLGQNFDLFSPAYDITYLTTAIPFCLLAMTAKNDD